MFQESSITLTCFFMCSCAWVFAYRTHMWRSDSAGPQPWWQVPLPAATALWPLFLLLLYRGPHVAQASFKLTIQPRWPWVPYLSCFCLSSAGITGMRHYTWCNGLWNRHTNKKPANMCANIAYRSMSLKKKHCPDETWDLIHIRQISKLNHTPALWLCCFFKY